MSKNEQDDGGGKGVNNIAKFSGLGFQMLAIIAVFFFAGYKIDQSANHQVKWVTAMLALIGVFISLYLVIRSIKE